MPYLYQDTKLAGLVTSAKRSCYLKDMLSMSIYKNKLSEKCLFSIFHQRTKTIIYSQMYFGRNLTTGGGDLALRYKIKRRLTIYKSR
jgi:hypothetical protein